jgi:hypothetical protein
MKGSVTVINLNERDFNFYVDCDLPRRPGIHSFNGVLAATLLISFLLHCLLFLLKPLWHSAEIQSSQSIEIRLQKIELPQVQIPEPIETERKSVLNNTPLSEELPQKSTEKPLNEVATTRMNSNTEITKPLELLSPEDYVSLAKDHVKTNSSDSLAFNPHLKKHLQETRQVANERGKKSISWQDTGGNLYYKAGGQCFMSPSREVTSSVREIKNWYMVSCAGKSESEKMMENIDFEMKQKFKH